MERTMCRICLATNVRMNWIVNTDLQNVYETLTNHLLEAEARPLVACYICYAQLQHCYQLIVRCLKAEAILTKIINHDQDCYDAEKDSLNPGKLLSVTEITQVTCSDVFRSDNTQVKEEPVSEVDDNEEINPEEVEVVLNFIQKTEPSPEPDLCESISQVDEEHYQTPCRMSEYERHLATLIDIKVPDTITDNCHIGNKSQTEPSPDPNLCESTSQVDEEQYLTPYRSSEEEQSLNTLKDIKKLNTNVQFSSETAPSPDPNLCESTSQVDEEQYLTPYRSSEEEQPLTTLKDIKKLNTNVQFSSETEPSPDPALYESTAQGNEEHYLTPYRSSEEEQPLTTLKDIKKLNTNIVHHIGIKKREEIILLHQQKVAISEIARRLKLSRRTVQLWVHRYTDSVSIDARRPGPPRITYKDDNLLHRAIVEAHIADPFLSTRVTAAKLNVSLQTVRNHLLAAGGKCQRPGVPVSNMCRYTVSPRMAPDECSSKHCFRCDICQMSFNEKSHLISHIQTHAGQQPYECGTPQISNNRENDSDKHIQRHNSQKPYECDVCHRSYSTKGTLNRHIRTHTGDKQSSIISDLRKVSVQWVL